MKHCIVNLGCKINRVEADEFERLLSRLGSTSTDLEHADPIIINTCTVTGEAEKKTRKAVRHALRENTHARVIVTGCAAAINPDVFTTMDERVEVVAKSQMSDYLRGYGGKTQALTAHLRSRVGVKVQDGCNNACTYCIVHVARGRATSRPLREIVDEVSALVSAGVREIVLTGINLGSYNSEGTTLAQLLRHLLDVTSTPHVDGNPLVRFRVSSVEPMDVGDALIDVLASANGRVCRHLHLPLQSGSSRVLRDMARPYTAEEYETLARKLRACLPELSLTTDVIVGFPGETEEDFAQTCTLACDCAFSKIHVFPYSMRQGTPAAARPDQVSPEVKLARAAKLRALSGDLRAQEWARRVGTTEFVLVEQPGRAMAESYFEVKVSPELAQGMLAPIRLSADMRM